MIKNVMLEKEKQQLEEIGTKNVAEYLSSTNFLRDYSSLH
jgi:hypothetical protein